MNYVSGKMIRELREKKKMTQKELAEVLQVSDRTVSKWETERGLPDVSLISRLSLSLGVSVAELFAGEYAINYNRTSNMLKAKFYICPICGNIIQAIGEGNFNCCGIKLIASEIEEKNEGHFIQCELIENDFYLNIEHSMEKNHYISFVAYITSESINMIKFYPEQNAQCRFSKSGHGFIYAYCNRHGLFRINV